MDNTDDNLHHAWIEMLVAAGMAEIAALVIDGSLTKLKSHFDDEGVIINIPPSAYTYVNGDAITRQVLEKTVIDTVYGHLFDQNGELIARNVIRAEFRVQVQDADADWRNLMKTMIANAKEGNQGSVTQKVFERQKAQPLVYNEMNFGSQSEIRIAQEFENRGVMFFPLPLAVRRDTGTLWKDQREPDFLVCHDGVWGILEVAFHPDRYEQDKEKDAWFKKSGILCVEHFTAESCFNKPGAVVDEFLTTLAKHRR